MTPREVADIAFEGSLNVVDADFIPEAVILSAQQKFIKPALNGLYDKIMGGGYAALTDEYVKPALAYYVRYLLLPTVSAQVGTVGVIQPKGAHFSSAADKTVAAVRRRTRSDANALMNRLVEHIEALPGDYPEYDPAQNVRNRVSTDAGVVL